MLLCTIFVYMKGRIHKFIKIFELILVVESMLWSQVKSLHFGSYLSLFFVLSYWCYSSHQIKPIPTTYFHAGKVRVHNLYPFNDICYLKIKKLNKKEREKDWVNNVVCSSNSGFFTMYKTKLVDKGNILLD